MRRKYKLTGCARFLIFLIIAVPIIYISATLITGTSPWEELKMMISGDKEKTEIIDTVESADGVKRDIEMESTTDGKEPIHSPAAATQKEITDQEQLNVLLKRIESLERQLKELEQQLEN